MFKKSLLFEIIKWNYTNYYYYYYRIEIFWRDISIKIQWIFLPLHFFRLHPTLFNRRVIFIIWMDSNKDKKFHGTWLIPTASIVSRLWKLEFYSWRKRATQFHPYECNSDIREQLYSFISTVSSIVIYIYIALSKILITYILYTLQLLTLYLTSNTVLQLNENGNQGCIRAIKQSTEDKRSTSNVRVLKYEIKKRKSNPKTCHRLYNRVEKLVPTPFQR